MGTDRKMSIGTISRANGKQTMPTCIYKEITEEQERSVTYPCPLVKGSRVMVPAASARCRCHVALQDGHIHIRAHGAAGDVEMRAPASLRLEALRAALRLAGGAA